MIALILSVIFLISPIIFLLYFAIKAKKKQLEERESLPDDLPVMDEVQEDTYNKYPLWIREEDRAIWDGYTRAQKRDLMRLQEKKIKSGELVKVTDENGFTGLITRKEAREKGVIK